MFAFQRGWLGFVRSGATARGGKKAALTAARAA
jgi:hypothetical protein